MFVAVGSLEFLNQSFSSSLCSTKKVFTDVRNVIVNVLCRKTHQAVVDTLTAARRTEPLAVLPVHHLLRENVPIPDGTHFDFAFSG